eukprot:CAMPEP_0116912586 /NCGR_PEP_ID=MMETSP0467-20121206/16173_1 /TAXON_ID=283647 /ORGANISM="Mesodinium pulex, Strain SPMC105" /LENGTH=103 /DNA_ID=CAMNT_0004588591 /DNA_START=1059 /DNA_END=1370 /DNA_ORIENTATION=+
MSGGRVRGISCQFHVDHFTAVPGKHFYFLDLVAGAAVVAVGAVGAIRDGPAQRDTVNVGHAGDGHAVLLAGLLELAHCDAGLHGNSVVGLVNFEHLVYFPHAD